MVEDHTQYDGPPAWPNRVLILFCLGVIAVLVPWLLQDPNYRDLARLPLTIDAPSGVDIRKIHGLISRQERHDSKKIRYLVQFTFEVTHNRRTRVHGLRLKLHGVDSENRTVFTVRARPTAVDVAPGETVKVFVRAKDLPPATVDRLGRLLVTAKARRPAGPR